MMTKRKMTAQVHGAGEHESHKIEIMKLKIYEKHISSIFHDRIRCGEN